MSLDLAALDPSVVALTGDASRHDHFVELYDDPDRLIESVARFVSLGTERNEAAVVVITPEHRDALERKLAQMMDLRAAREQGLYRFLDAEQTLSLFMDDGIPNSAKFERELSRIVGLAAHGGRRVRIFGEMVAVLWGEGKIGGALRLEDLWNGLAERLDFRLFCAYPVAGFGGQNMAPLRAVCRRHSHVIAAPAPV